MKEKYALWLTKEQINFLNELFVSDLVSLAPVLNKLDADSYAELDDAIYDVWDQVNSTRATEKGGRVVGGSF